MSRRAGIGLLALAACGGEGERSPSQPVIPRPLTAEEGRRALQLSPLPALAPDPTNAFADHPAAARFGQRLFFDERLSRDADRACATCHDPAQAFTDGERVAIGLLPLERHTPTLINAAHQRWQFWDGRVDRLWSQALVPFESPLEHASSRLQILHVVAADSILRAEYEAIFGPLPAMEAGARFPPVGRPVPADDHAHKLAAEHAAKSDGGSGGHAHPEGGHFYHPHQRAWDTLTPEDQAAVTRAFVNLGKAIAAYERRLVAGRSPFDVFVEGMRTGDEDKLAALGDPARRGLQLFLGKANCHFCHGGPLFSDLEFHDLGFDGNDPGRSRGLEALRRFEFLGTSSWSDDPHGEARIQVDFLPTHRHVGSEFKTPSLRNVAVTPPYMHDGRFATLKDVVDFYSGLAEQRDSPPTLETILEPLDLTDRERADLVAFLEALTDVNLDPTLARPPE